jgi:hypothetical protein
MELPEAFVYVAPSAEDIAPTKDQPQTPDPELNISGSAGFTTPGDVVLKYVPLTQDTAVQAAAEENSTQPPASCCDSLTAASCSARAKTESLLSPPETEFIPHLAPAKYNIGSARGYSLHPQVSPFWSQGTPSTGVSQIDLKEDKVAGVDKCPACHEAFDPKILLKDGGSNICPACKVTFHVCVEGAIRFGSPGPAMCQYCRGRDSGVPPAAAPAPTGSMVSTVERKCCPFCAQPLERVLVWHRAGPADDFSRQKKNTYTCCKACKVVVKYSTNSQADVVIPF